MSSRDDYNILNNALNSLPLKWVGKNGEVWLAEQEEINDQWGYCRRFYRPKSIFQRIYRWLNPNATSCVKVLIELHYPNCSVSVMNFTYYKNWLDCNLSSGRYETFLVEDLKSILPELLGSRR